MGKIERVVGKVARKMAQNAVGYGGHSKLKPLSLGLYIPLVNENWGIAITYVQP